MFNKDITPDKKSIFVSRRLSTLNPVLITLNSMGYHVIHEALIKTSPIRFTHTPPSHWIFFPGRDAIRYFFSQQPSVKRGVKFGVVSPVSAEYLKNFGHEASFTGTGVDVVQIGKDFARFIKDESVLIPQAIDSLQIIQKQLAFTNSCHNLFVYKTQFRDDIPEIHSEIIAFTSPSNVQAYFQKYKLKEGQKVIAIGSTTLLKLREHNVKEVVLAEGFDDASLFGTIMSLVDPAGIRR